MNTSLASATAKMNEIQRKSVDDRRRRLVYSGGTPHMACNPKTSGIESNPIEGGRLYVIAPGRDTMNGAFNEGTGSFDKKEIEIMPVTYIRGLYRKFVESDAGDMGLRELRSLIEAPYEYGNTAEESYDLAFDYFNVLHPPLSKPCPFGLERVYSSVTPGNLNAQMYQSCPTCRLEELKSEACSERIFQASQSLDSGILQALREELIAACEATLAFADYQISVTEGQLEGAKHGEVGAKKTRNEIDQVYLKMRHRRIDAVREQETQQQIEILTTSLQNALQGAASQPVKAEAPAEAPAEDVIVLSGEDKAKYEEWQKRSAALAKAREVQKQNKATKDEEPKEE
ncbi:hypothetical protein [Geitlerinema calcuttense]|uniref:Uncharacterized protein n=1 Tax=Geitlerinema calcuttense NRMC-F 0142 TaxID=2922238 RepID=A0ABT7LV26_9CYAN|nr:hypothetical protein [Geitlerinema calcuttense]MDL5055893.1 hypothetical protein [Geitlerinema calcuttense NRMC-F 0142]